VLSSQLQGYVLGQARLLPIRSSRAGNPWQDSSSSVRIRRVADPQDEARLADRITAAEQRNLLPEVEVFELAAFRTARLLLGLLRVRVAERAAVCPARAPPLLLVLLHLDEDTASRIILKNI
jgi:hypothetical protein